MTRQQGGRKSEDWSDGSVRRAIGMRWSCGLGILRLQVGVGLVTSRAAAGGKVDVLGCAGFG